MGHVLVDDPQAVFIHRQDERIADLPQRPERGERRQSGFFVVGVLRRIERGGATIVWNRLRNRAGEAAFQSAGHGNCGVGLDGNSALELEACGN